MSFTKMKPHKKDKDRERMRKKKKSHVNAIVNLNAYKKCCRQVRERRMMRRACERDLPINGWSICDSREL